MIQSGPRPTPTENENLDFINEFVQKSEYFDEKTKETACRKLQQVLFKNENGLESSETTRFKKTKGWFQYIDDHPATIIPVLGLVIVLVTVGGNMFNSWFTRPFKNDIDKIQTQIDALELGYTNFEAKLDSAKTTVVASLNDAKKTIRDEVDSSLKSVKSVEHDVALSRDALNEIKDHVQAAGVVSQQLASIAKNADRSLKDLEIRLEQIRIQEQLKTKKVLDITHKEREAFHRFLMNRIAFDLKSTMALSPSQLSNQEHLAALEILQQNHSILTQLHNDTGEQEYGMIAGVHLAVESYMNSLKQPSVSDTPESDDAKIIKTMKLLLKTLDYDLVALNENRKSVKSYLNFAMGTACLNLYERLKSRNITPRRLHLTDAQVYLTNVDNSNVLERALTNLGVCYIHEFDLRSEELFTSTGMSSYEQLSEQERVELRGIVQQAVNCFERNRFYEPQSKGHSILVNNLGNALYYQSLVETHMATKIDILRRAERLLSASSFFADADPIVHVTLAEIRCALMSAEFSGQVSTPEDRSDAVIEDITKAYARGYRFPYESLEQLLSSRNSRHPFTALQITGGSWKTALRDATGLR